MLGQKFVLRAASFILARGVDDEDLLFAVLIFSLAEDEDATGEAGTIEQVRAKTDEGIEQIHLEDFFSYLAFLAHAEERAVRKHNRHPACSRGHRLDHMLHPGIVAALTGRYPRKVPPVWVAGPDFIAPFLQ